MRPYHECPGFYKCNVNVCPLDPLSNEKEALKGEDKCKAEKPTRMRIGAKYPDLLRFVGLTKREFQARERWNAISPEQKELKLQALSKARKSIPHKLKIMGLVILGILLYAIPIYAQQELKVKAGYMSVMNDGVSGSPVIAGEYEVRNKYIGLGIEAEGFAPDIEDVNRLYCSSLSLIPKIYIANLYLGFKGGYIFNTIGDNMDSDDEVSRGAVLGINMGQWFIEGQVNIADMDIETGITTIPEPKIEQRSRLDNWQILVGKKWKF